MDFTSARRKTERTSFSLARRLNDVKTRAPAARQVAKSSGARGAGIVNARARPENFERKVGESWNAGEGGGEGYRRWKLASDVYLKISCFWRGFIR